jgi:hypothetical protein
MSRLQIEQNWNGQICVFFLIQMVADDIAHPHINEKEIN